MIDARQELENVAAELGLTVTFEYVPQKYPVTHKVKDMQRKWKVTVHKNGKPILTTDYSEGIGHCDAYPKGGNLTVRDSLDIRKECEQGPKSGSPKHPLDALWCIASDCNSLDTTSGFEDWATTFGYDPDSRKAYATWEQINEQYHILKSVIGHDGIDRLATVEL